MPPSPRPLWFLPQMWPPDWPDAARPQGPCAQLLLPQGALGVLGPSLRRDQRGEGQELWGQAGTYGTAEGALCSCPECPCHWLSRVTVRLTRRWGLTLLSLPSEPGRTWRGVRVGDQS